VLSLINSYFIMGFFVGDIISKKIYISEFGNIMNSNYANSGFGVYFMEDNNIKPVYSSILYKLYPKFKTKLPIKSYYSHGNNEDEVILRIQNTQNQNFCLELFINNNFFGTLFN